MDHERRQGFTLVEMLVLVAILTVLLALLLPSMEQAKYQARLATCASNLRQMAVGSTLYATDHQNLYPNGPPVGKSFFPEGVDKAMRLQLHRAHPAVFGDYLDGNVSPVVSEVMRCPQIMAEGKGELYTTLGASQYQLYFNATASIRSQHTLVDGTAGTYAVPHVYTETMPRLGSARITNANSFSGGGVWESKVVASDIAFLRLSRVASGHMQGGTRDYYGGPQQLKQGSRDAYTSANYAFQDGSVEPFSFTRSNVAETMIYIDDGSAGGSGGYLIPQGRSRQLD